MNHIDSSVEGYRLTEKGEAAAWYEPFGGVFNAFEKDELHLAGAVADYYAELFGLGVLAYDFCQNLDVGRIRDNFSDGYYSAPVNVPEGVEMQKIIYRMDIQFLAKEGGSFGADSRQKLNF